MKRKVTLEALKQVRSLNVIKFAVCMVVVVGLGASALASCGDSLSAMARGAAAIADHSRPTQQDSGISGKNAGSSSVVGLWHVRFEVKGQTIQEAYQLWNAGGTEVHNPNVDPRTGNVCLGVWMQEGKSRTYDLNHRVWNYDDSGDFLGTIRLHEKVTLGSNGDSHRGSFSLDFYDPSGKFLMKVPGNVVAQRISVE
jgi:hypothetical protein